jgi:hypothetical protein
MASVVDSDRGNLRFFSIDKYLEDGAFSCYRMVGDDVISVPVCFGFERDAPFLTRFGVFSGGEMGEPITFLNRGSAVSEFGEELVSCGIVLARLVAILTVSILSDSDQGHLQIRLFDEDDRIRADLFWFDDFKSEGIPDTNKLRLCLPEGVSDKKDKDKVYGSKDDGFHEALLCGG